jgi:hypothetical protein
MHLVIRVYQHESASDLLSALLTVRFFSNQEEIFKLPFSRSAASRLGKSGLSISLVAACRAAFICVHLRFQNPFPPVHRKSALSPPTQCLKMLPSPAQLE